VNRRSAIEWPTTSSIVRRIRNGQLTIQRAQIRADDRRGAERIPGGADRDRQAVNRMLRMGR